MASIRRSSGTSGPDDSSSGEGETFDVVGIKEPVSGSSGVRSEIVQGGHFRSLSVPNSVSQNGTATVSGVIHLDDPVTSVVIPSDLRVRISGPSLTQEYTRDFRLTHCQTRTFSFDIPARGEPGDTMVLNVEILAIGLAANPVEASRGPFRVNVVSASSAAIGRTVEFLPYAAGGAAGGILLSQITDGDNLTYGLIGGGVGAAAKASGVNVGLNTFDINETELVLVGAGLAGIGVFLNQSGASEVLQPAGEAAGRAIESGRERLRSRR